MYTTYNTIFSPALLIEHFQICLDYKPKLNSPCSWTEKTHMMLWCVNRRQISVSGLRFSFCVAARVISYTAKSAVFPSCSIFCVFLSSRRFLGDLQMHGVSRSRSRVRDPERLYLAVSDSEEGIEGNRNMHNADAIGIRIISHLRSFRPRINQRQVPLPLPLFLFSSAPVACPLLSRLEINRFRKIIDRLRRSNAN